jgi:hypothetical protein
MGFFRSRKRLTTRTSSPRQTWDMNRKRSWLLKIKQLFQGKFLAVLAVLVLGTGLIYGAFFTPLLSVQSVEVNTDNRDINVERLSTAINQELVGKNELLLSLESLENSAYEEFPDISSLSCSRNFLSRTISCTALGYELVAVINHEANKYYINENGVIIGYDGRKLGLPIFDLILNPVFAEIEARKSKKEETPTAISAPVPTPAPIEPVVPAPLPSVSTLNFTSPSQDPPVEPLVIREERSVFEVTVGKKILEAKELKLILEAIKSLEEVMERRVVNVQYVQVAGELSLLSKPAPKAPTEPVENTDEEPFVDEVPASPALPSEPADHEFTVLLDLRRSLEDQFKKLVKTKDVIDFSEVSRIDLSIDGEKVFYR